MCFVPQRRAFFHPLLWPDGFAPAAFASLLADPPEPSNHWKNKVVPDFSTFLRTCIFFLLFFLFSDLLSFSLLFSSLTLPTSVFHLSISLEFGLLLRQMCLILHVQFCCSVFRCFGFFCPRVLKAISFHFFLECWFETHQLTVT